MTVSLDEMSGAQLLEIAEHRLAAERRAAERATAVAAEIVFRQRPAGWDVVVDRPLRPRREAIAAAAAYFVEELPELDPATVFEVAVREGATVGDAAAGLRDGLIRAGGR